MSDGADFISDLKDLPEGVVDATHGSVEANRSEGDVHSNARPDTPKVEPVEGEKPASLRDQISTALKGEATPPAAQIDGGLVRNADGTFAPKPVTETPPVDPNAPPAAAEAVQYPQQGIPGLDATVFASLPAETQQAVARTMDTLNEQGARFAAYDQLERVISPRRQTWAMNGVSEAQAINQLLALSDFASRDPAGFIRQVAHQNNVDLEELAFGAEPVDPDLAAANQRIAQLEQQQQAQVAQQQQAAYDNTVNEIVQFADEKGADGKTLLRPHFVELGQEVLPFIDAAMKSNPNRPRTAILTEAYEAACWASPKVRPKMFAAQQAAAEAERIRTATETAARARAAGVSVPTGSPGDGVGKPAVDQSGNLRDTIRSAVAAST